MLCKRGYVDTKWIDGWEKHLKQSDKKGRTRKRRRKKEETERDKAYRKR